MEFLNFLLIIKIFGIEISIEVLLGFVTVIVAIIFGIPVIKTWKSEKKKYTLKKKTLFKDSGWINASQLSYASLDLFREMKKERNPTSQTEVKESIRRILDKRKEIEIQNHILLVGPSLSGKSHIAVSVLKNLEDAYILIPNEDTFIEAARDGYELPDAPENAQYKILLLENFHEFFKTSSEAPKSLIHKAIKKGLTIWANCISIEEYAKVKSFLDFKDGSLGPFQEIELDKKLTSTEAEMIAVDIGSGKLPASFNGLIGEIFYPPEDIFQHYNDLKSDAVAFDVLLFIKQAYILGAFTLPYLMKLELIKKAFSKKYSTDYISLMNTLKKIEEKGFIKLLYDHTTFSFDSVWLNEIVAPEMKAITFFPFWEDIIPRNDYKTAVERYEKIEKGKADVIVYNSIISKSPNYETALEWFNKIEKGKADIFSYNPLIVKSPNYETAVEWFNKIAKGAANFVTYSSLISKSPNYETALEWFNKIKEGEATTITYNSLINLSPNYKIALEWFKRIEAGTATLITYNSLINLSPNYETAVDWFQKIKQGEVNLITYTSLITLSPNYETALDWYSKIEKGKANEFTYNSLIHLSPNYETALDWFQKIDKNKANVITYNSLINLSPNYETALDWYYNIEREQADEFTYNSLISQSPEIDSALNWLHKMENKQLEIDNYTYGALIKVAGKSRKENKYQLAISLHDEMLNKGIYSDVAILTNLISLAPDFEQGFNLLKLMTTLKDKNNNWIIPNERTRKTIEIKAHGNPDLMKKVDALFLNIHLL